MTISQICRKAEDISRKFNPDGLAPFPFEKILKEYTDIKLLSPTDMPDDYSGAISFQKGQYYIFINPSKPEKRQYFTIAHELGHYFLHKEYLEKGQPILDFDRTTNLGSSSALYRPDDISELSVNLKRLEVEANNFAASMIMPEKLVRAAWETTDENIETCAEIFKVSTVAMSVRLERLGLVD